MGALVAVMLHHRQGFALLGSMTRFRLAPWVWLAVLGAVYALSPPALRGWPNLIIHIVMCLALTSLVVREDNGMAALLRLRPIARIGQISYGMYLYHLFALAIVLKIFPAPTISEWWIILVSYFILSDV
jgi:peptidoglycan/LPS O-acetylase OafA/YrhL